MASGDWATDAEWAWVRRSLATGEPSEFVLLRGRRLSWRGRALVQAEACVPRLAGRLRGSESASRRALAGARSSLP